MKVFSFFVTVVLFLAAPALLGAEAEMDETAANVPEAETETKTAEKRAKAEKKAADEQKKADEKAAKEKATAEKKTDK